VCKCGPPGFAIEFDLDWLFLESFHYRTGQNVEKNEEVPFRRGLKLNLSTIKGHNETCDGSIALIDFSNWHPHTSSGRGAHQFRFHVLEASDAALSVSPRSSLDCESVSHVCLREIPSPNQ
jgi:hypothetical protein